MSGFKTPSPAKLTELTDVVVSAPAVNQILEFNGTNWINGAQVAVGAGPGIMFYLDSTEIIPPGPGPDTIAIETLSKTPTGGAEVFEAVTVNGSAVATATGMIDQYLYNTALNILSIPAGEWQFDTYCYVDNAAGISQILISVGRVFIGVGTITIPDGAGTSRTATVTGGTPFLGTDFNADISLTSYIITPKAVLRIIGYTSTSIVTVETLSTYPGETGVTYSVDRFLFQDTTGEINDLTVTLFTHTVVEPAFACNTTDKLTVRYYGKTNNVGDIIITFVHNGTIHYTRIHTPLPTLHNDLAGLQGGGANEDYHSTLAEYTGTGTGVFVRATALPGPSATVVTETTFGQASNAGAAATFSKGDHTHGTPTAGTIVTQNANNVAITGGSVTGLTSFSVTGGLTDTQISASAAIALSKLAALTQGQVVFPNVSGVMTGDANLFWDNTNKRLGIGTATPGATLHLNDPSSSILFLDGSVTGSPYIQWSQNNVSKAYIQYLNASGRLLLAQAPVQISTNTFLTGLGAATTGTPLVLTASNEVRPAAPFQQNEVVGTRAANTPYHNTGNTPMFVQINFSDNSVISASLNTDVGNPPTHSVWGLSTVIGIRYSATTWVLPGNWYEITAAGIVTLYSWTEWTWG